MNEHHANPAPKMRRRPATFKDLTGQRFGRLTVIEEAGKGGSNAIIWRCRCDCGVERFVQSRNLNSGTQSCGCIQREGAKSVCINNRINARAGDKTISVAKYRVLAETWYGMVGRCSSPEDKSWHNYGARGIAVCARWLGPEGMRNFMQDMGPAWRPGLTLDRADNDGAYSIENCRWATRFEQARNRRTNLLITVNGTTKCLKDWAAEAGLTYRAAYYRFRRGRMEWLSGCDKNIAANEVLKRLTLDPPW
jgi:hypothetical protein